MTPPVDPLDPIAVAGETDEMSSRSEEVR